MDKDCVNIQLSNFFITFVYYQMGFIGTIPVMLMTLTIMQDLD